MADLPETLHISINIPPGNVSAGATILAISTIGLGVPGNVGPPPSLAGGPVTTLAPDTPATMTLVPTGYGAWRLDLGLPEGRPGADGTGNLNAVGAVTAGHMAIFVNGTAVEDGGLPFSGSYLDLSNLPSLFSGQWVDLGGTPSTFPPSAHIHAIVDVTGLQNALDAKQATMTKAVGAELRAGSDDAKFVTAKAVADATAISSSTGSGTWNANLATAGTPKRIANGNSTLGAPTGGIEGRVYAFLLQQDATGSRTWSFAANFDFGAAGTPTASTGANKVDIVFAICIDASTQSFRASFNKAS